MAVMAAAAIGGGVAVSAGVAVSTIAMIGVGATVVGMVTKNKTLMKIGAGLGLGAGVASLTGIGSGAAGAGAAAASPAEAALAANNVAAVPETLAGAGAYVSPGEAAALSAQGIDAQIGSSFAQGGVDYSLTAGLPASPGAAINAAMPGGTHLAGSVSGELGQGLVQGASAPGISAAGLGEAAGVSAWADLGVTGAMSAPMPAPWYAANPVFQGKTLQASTSWWGGFKNWWKGLDSPAKLAVGQMGAGLVKGVGEGMMTMQAEDRKYDFLENERDWRRANMSYAPQFNFTGGTGLVRSAMPQG